MNHVRGEVRMDWFKRSRVERIGLNIFKPNSAKSWICVPTYFSSHPIAPLKRGGGQCRILT